VQPAAEDDEVGKPGEPVLWGRGTVDATGPLVAMAVAAVQTGVSFVGVAGEETNSRGRTIPRRGPRRAGGRGERRALRLGRRYPRLPRLPRGDVREHERVRPTSRPEPNAIQHAIDWWHGVEETFEPTDPDTPVFEQVTTKPVSFDGGLTDDGLAVEASMDVQLRVPPNRTVDEIHELAETELSTGSVHWKEPIPR